MIASESSVPTDVSDSETSRKIEKLTDEGENQLSLL